jgi:beta-glucosidase
MHEQVSRRAAIKGVGGAIVAAGVVTTATATPADASPTTPSGTPTTAAQANTRPQQERRVDALLARMTLEEKLGQLQQTLAGGGSAAVRDAVRAGRVGSVFGDIVGATVTNALQHVAVEESRLGIPLLIGFDVIHGYLTTFPVPLAQASSFDPAVARGDAEVAAREAASSGIRWTFAPMVDVTREPRWGRIVEGYGEDPFLASAFAAAKVRGYQGTNFGAVGQIAACAKHYVAYGGAEGGRDYNTVDVSEHRLRDVYLPPFQAAVDAGVATLMASFNTVNGVPAHANRHTLSQILKGEWGFDGFVVSDYTGIAELIVHGVAADLADAGRLALTAGVDMEMVSSALLTHGQDLIHRGLIHMSRVDDAVRRILRIKFRAGLFDRPYVDASAEVTQPAPDSLARARQAAARSMVLLKNTGPVLPLSPGLRSVAVVGPLGDDTANLHGAWAGPGAGRFPAVSVLAGIRAAAPTATVSFTAGCTVSGTDTGGIAAAVDAARAADVTVVVVGESSDLSGEAASRSNLGLPGVQGQLVRALRDAGRPLVLVVLAGRPLVLGDEVDAASAVLIGWHPGIQGGHAVADILSGAVNPGGKLPVTFPRSVGQLPIYYAHENTGRPADPSDKNTSKYLDLPSTPEFEFGFGLSYTTFDISGLTLSPTKVPANGIRSGRSTVEVKATVTNTGGRPGDEVVQLYLRDPVASVAQPVRRLRGFSRVTLGAGESKTVVFRLGAQDLGFHDSDGRLVVEPGSFDVFVGNSSSAELRRTFEVT